MFMWALVLFWGGNGHLLPKLSQNSISVCGLCARPLLSFWIKVGIWQTNLWGYETLHLRLVADRYFMVMIKMQSTLQQA